MKTYLTKWCYSVLCICWSFRGNKLGMGDGFTFWAHLRFVSVCVCVCVCFDIRQARDIHGSRFKSQLDCIEKNQQLQCCMSSLFIKPMLSEGRTKFDTNWDQRYRSLNTMQDWLRDSYWEFCIQSSPIKKTRQTSLLDYFNLDAICANSQWRNMFYFTTEIDSFNEWK